MESQPKKTRLVPVLIGVIVGVLIGLAIFCFTPLTCEDCEVELVDVIFASPCDSVPEPPGEVVMALTGGTTFENEIHDCQRLVVPDDSDTSQQPAYEFGPLVGIFPLDAAMAIDNASGFAGGMAVATLFNWGGLGFKEDPQIYRPLGIAPGWNCLWMRSSGAVWQAAIGQTDTTCAGLPAPGHLAWSDLRVDAPEILLRESTPAIPGDTTLRPIRDSGGTDLIPRTARWGWDDATSTHYIGIRCGNGWCSIGIPPFQPPPQLSGLAHRAIPGWYDAEHLAVADASGRLRPGPWATIYPDETSFELRHETERRSDFFRASQPNVAAVIVVESADASELGAYVDKWGLDLRSDPDTVYITLALDNSGGATAWYHQTVGDAGMETNARSYQNTMHATMGAVRWRWLDTDQKQWISCDVNACCDVGLP